MQDFRHGSVVQKPWLKLDKQHKKWRCLGSRFRIWKKIENFLTHFMLRYVTLRYVTTDLARPDIFDRGHSLRGREIGSELIHVAYSTLKVYDVKKVPV